MKPFTSKHCTPINYGSPLNQSTFGLNDKQQKIMQKGREKVGKLRDKYEQEVGHTNGYIPGVNENSSKKAKRIDAREQRVRERFTKKIKAAG